MSVYYVDVITSGARRYIESPGTECTDVCELPNGCWEPIVLPLKGQELFLTTKPPLQPTNWTLKL